MPILIYLKQTKKIFSFICNELCPSQTVRKEKIFIFCHGFNPFILFSRILCVNLLLALIGIFLDIKVLAADSSCKLQLASVCSLFCCLLLPDFRLPSSQQVDRLSLVQSPNGHCPSHDKHSSHYFCFQ